MKRCALFCVGWWPFLLLPLLLLILVLLLQWRSIERDVAGYAGLALTDNRLTWATASTHNRGRNVLISGVAPNDAALQQALEFVSQAKGVNSVDFAGTIAPSSAAKTLSQENAATPPVTVISAPQVEVRFRGEQVVLRGTVADQTEIDTLINDAAAVYGAGNVVNELQTDDNIADLPFLFGLFSVAKGLGEENAITISGDTLRLSGVVSGLGVKKHIDSQLALFFSGEIDNQLKVVLPPVGDTQLVDEQECQGLLTNLLASTKVHFSTASAQVVPESYALLDAMVTMARRCPQAQFEVAGHTDASGDMAFNRQLSEQRAQAVVDHIVGSGLPADRFTVVGYGPDQPVADNETASGRAANRRIEFTLKN